MEKTFVRIRSVIRHLTGLLFVTLSLGIFGRIVLADGDKTPITMDMLRSAYEQHYSNNQKVSTILMIGIGIGALIILGVIVMNIIKIRRSDTSSKIIRMILVIMLIPTLGVFILILAFSTCSLATDPDPAEASYFLETLTVTRTDVEVSTDSDGDKSYSYYVYIADDRRDSGERKMPIDEAMYNIISEPGEYYFAKATSGKMATIFAVYPVSGFEPAPGIDVR